jgi:SAM-dependent methyltransferase
MPCKRTPLLVLSLASIVTLAACRKEGSRSPPVEASAASEVEPAAAPEAAQPAPAKDKPLRAPDVEYDPSPPLVVNAMLDLGRVSSADVVFDLGCGDGRIVIAAAKRGARGVCIDIDPVRIEESRRNAAQAGVSERITFHTQDLFESDLSSATVVMLFLYPDVNERLRPKLLSELKPGVRVVSHWHDMGSWKAEKIVPITADNEPRNLYFWTIPKRD